MIIKFRWSALGKSKWYEYAIRFVFGGAITVIAGLLAKHFGPALGGLFLAFPAIFPASVTLVQKHEEDKKRKAGILHSSRGRQAAALDARGSAYGSIGLVCFAILIWKFLPDHDAVAVLFFAMTAWLAVSFAIWRVSKLPWR
jgi:hypothetical protein